MRGSVAYAPAYGWRNNFDNKLVNWNQFTVTSHVYTAELDIDNLKFTLSSLIESLNGFVMKLEENDCPRKKLSGDPQFVGVPPGEK